MHITILLCVMEVEIYINAQKSKNGVNIVNNIDFIEIEL